MVSILQIDTSPRYEYSHSRSLAQEFIEKWSSHHSETQIFHRDLGLNPVPYIDASLVMNHWSFVKILACLYIFT